MLKSASIITIVRRKSLVFLHFKSFILLVSLTLGIAAAAMAQPVAPQTTPAKEEKKETKETKEAKPTKADSVTAEQVAESAIYVYSALVGGRDRMGEIRKTAIERGKVVLHNADGTTERSSYEKRSLRGENLEKEQVRLDQEFPSSRFALLYKEDKIVGLFNDQVFTPREEAALAFSNQIWRGLDGLLRYKENGSKIELNGREKIMGIEYYVLDLVDKNERKTRYFISVKTFRVMLLEYLEGGIKYVRKFYDYRYAQGTLVPYRNILLANGKQIEETTVLTVTYGQKLDDDIFQTN